MIEPDSICINQEDVKEKSIQLRYMWGIYKYAKQVLAWPGDVGHGGDLAMELLFDISFSSWTEQLTGRTPVDLPISSVAYLPEVNTALWKQSRPPIPPNFHFDPERWSALARFLDRPWWRRAWVIQEIVAAKEVSIMVGAGQPSSDNLTLSWKLFNPPIRGYMLEWKQLVEIIEHLECWRFLHLLEITDDVASCDLPLYPAAIAFVQRVKALKPSRDDQRPNCQDDLLLTMVAEASDPRDTVFAIRSISYGSSTKELWPNYELSFADTYINATRHLLMRDQYLMALHMAGIGWRRRVRSLPSWVPDYSIIYRTGTRLGKPLILSQIAGSAMFASANMWLSEVKSHVRYIGSIRQLIRIKEVVIDDIMIVCNGLSTQRSVRRSMESDNWFDRKVIHLWLILIRSQICLNDGSNPYLGQKVTKQLALSLRRAPTLESEALASALIVGSSEDGGPMSFSNLHTPLGMMYNLFTECVERSIRPCNISGSEIVVHGLSAYINALDRLPSWTVFRTASGYIGRGPPLVKIGDKICVLEGPRTPFVIRKVVLP